MSDLPEVLASEIAYTIGDREFRFARLTAKELAAFEQWVRKEAGKTAIEIVREAAPSESPSIVSAVMSYITMGTSGGMMKDYTESIGGIVQLLYLSASKADPEITYDEIAERIDMSNLVEVRVLADALASGGPIGGEGKRRPPASKGKAGRP